MEMTKCQSFDDKNRSKTCYYMVRNIWLSLLFVEMQRNGRGAFEKLKRCYLLSWDFVSVTEIL